MFQALDQDDSKEVDWEEFLSYFTVEWGRRKSMQSAFLGGEQRQEEEQEEAQEEQEQEEQQQQHQPQQQPAEDATDEDATVTDEGVAAEGGETDSASDVSAVSWQLSGAQVHTLLGIVQSAEDAKQAREQRGQREQRAQCRPQGWQPGQPGQPGQRTEAETDTEAEVRAEVARAAYGRLAQENQVTRLLGMKAGSASWLVTACSGCGSGKLAVNGSALQ